MLFNSVAFLVFFSILHSFYWLSKHKWRKWLLLFGSVVFYGYWSAPFLIHFLLIIYLNYLFYHFTRHIYNLKVLSIIAIFNFANLAFFKYYYFLRTIFIDLGFSGFSEKTPEIILPLAISFYTFQIMAFHVDIYRNHINYKVSLSDFTLFIMFFPQLIAGPILRSDEFINKINTEKKSSRVPVDSATLLILMGIVKKILIADNISIIVEPVFSNPGYYSSSGILIAVYGFAIQIYCDFAGYTDIARGIALLLGFKIPANFRAPYFSMSFQEFWRRWHITLSTWLRDYLYIPLGGNKFGAYKTYFNLFITMVLGGLWHGANYTFLVWGVLHGVYLCIERFFGLASRKRNIVTKIISSVFVFHLVCLGWIFFRAESIKSAFQIIQRIFALDGIVPPGTNQLGIYFLIFILLHILEYNPKFWNRFARFKNILIPASAICICFAIASVSSKSSTFIYFQF